MEILETSVFTRRLARLPSDDDYGKLQTTLVGTPTLGEVIPGTGGLRKVRWRSSGSGKRGGIRVIYYWAVRQDQLLMLFIYPKTERDKLTPKQLSALRKLVEEEYR